MFIKAKIIFAGLSTTTTPKIALIQDTLQKSGLDTEIVSITKYPEQRNKQTNFPINQKRTIFKVAMGVIQATRAIIHLAAQNSKQSICYAINPPSGLIALMLKILKGTPYLYETHEIFCGFKNEIYGGRKRHLWYRIEKLIIKNSTHFIATDEFRLRFLRRYYKINQTKSSFYLYNTTLASTSSTQEYEPQRGTVSYCGGIYPDRMIDTIIKAFGLSTKANQLVLAGTYDPAYKNELERLIRSIRLDGKVHFTGIIPNPAIRKAMAESEVTIAIYARDCTNNRLCSPNKFFDAIATNTQIITTKSPLAKQLLIGNKFGDICEPLNEHTLATKIDQALDRTRHSKDLNINGINNRYLWDTESKKLERAIKDLSS